MQSENLIQTLVEQSRQLINQAEKLKSQDADYLSWRAEANSWSILECLEHLNLYGDYYLPAIEKSIQQSKTKPDPVFKSGVLGSYFAKSMLPKEKLNKMNTFKDKNPLNQQLDKTVIDRFIQQQLKFIELLNRSRKVSLNKVKISTSISTLIKIKLGDTFQFIMNHNLRHFAQMERIQAQMKNVAVPV